MSRFTIVSMCGGGMRGLLSSQILERLAGDNPKILSGTKLFAGTSTGSTIINYLVAGWNPAQISANYLTNGREYFSKPVGKDPGKPRYDIAKIAAGLALIHGDKKLGDFQQKMLFTAFFVGQQATVVGPGEPPFIPWSPRLYTNLERGGTPTTSIVDAVTESSAMPGMMGSWKRCVDGAFVNHDPSICAIAAAVENGVALEDIALINLGTGLMPDWVAEDTAHWGAAQWLNGSPGAGPTVQAPPFFLNWELPTPALDMALSGTSANLTPLLVEKLLGPERYVNLNPKLRWYIPEDATSENDMTELRRAAADCDLTHAREVMRSWNDAL